MPDNEKVHWKNEYTIGIRSIDNQHKKLFELVNRLFELDENPNIKEEIRDILYAFRDYTIVHFSDEEEYMRSIGYPELEAHIETHKHIVESLHKIIQVPAPLNIIKVKMKVVAKRVLIDHIVNEDHKIGVFVRENEAIYALHNDTLVSESPFS